MLLDLDREAVLSQARALDMVPHDQRGPLHGLPIGIKDIMDTQGITRQLVIHNSTDDADRLTHCCRYAHTVRLAHL